MFDDGRASFAAIYRNNVNFVTRLVRRSGIAAYDSEDATQDVFLIVYKKFRGAADDATVRKYLRAVASRVCSNRRRASRRCALRGRAARDVDTDTLYALAPLPEETAALNENVDLFTRAVARLDAEKRAVLILAELEGLSTAKIAERLGVCPGTAASRLRAARSKLSSSLRHVKRAR